MKQLFTIVINSEGSVNITKLSYLLVSKKLFIVKLKDDLNVFYNQKSKKRVLDVTQGYSSKKKYLN